MRRLAFALVLLLVPTGALADDAPAPLCEPNVKPKFIKHETRDGKRIYIADEPIIFCVKVPRPGVAFVQPAKQLNYSWEELKQDFLPLVQASVQKAPF